MKQLFEKANQLIQDLIDIRYKQSDLFIKLNKNKDSTATQFKIKNYIKWKTILTTHINNDTRIINKVDIKNLKLTEKLDLKLCELFDTGDIKDIDDAKLELITLEKQLYGNMNSKDKESSLSNSIVSIDSTIDDSFDQEVVEVVSKIDTKIDTLNLESIPKVLSSITRPSDKKGGSVYDLQLLHGIGEKSAIKLYENGVTLEGLLSEWTQWITRDSSNAILLPQKMAKPSEYTKSKWDSLEYWKQNSILENNLKQKLDNETKQLCKIHKDTLIG